MRPSSSACHPRATETPWSPEVATDREFYSALQVSKARFMIHTIRRGGARLAAGWLVALALPWAAGASAISEPDAAGQTALHRVMKDNRSWPMIHAAEMLVTHGEAALVHDYFRSEFVGREAAPLRTGVWRVLASTSASHREREEWIGRIVAVFRDRSAPDRDLALETLCKLGYVPKGEVLEEIRRFAAGVAPEEQVIPRWALVLSGDRAAKDEIVAGLDSTNDVIRRRSGYVLRWLKITDPAVIRRLEQVAATQASGSDVQIFLASAVVSLGVSSDVAAWREKLAGLLPSASSSARYEACQALAVSANERELPAMLRLLGDPDDDTRVGAAHVVLSVVGPGAGRQARTIKLGELPLLFVDDVGVASRRNLVRTQHPARVSSKPIMVADRPWEGERVYLFGTVRFEPKKSLFEMWYVGVPARGEVFAETKQVFVKGFREGGATLMLYATSRDGVIWDKPSLGLHEFAGSTANNIVFDLDSPTIEVDERDADPARRYKLVGYSTRGYRSAVSPDGLHWTDTSPEAIFSDDDLSNMARDPVTGEFLVYHKKPYITRGFDRRVVWLSTSRDFRTWTSPRLVLSPDEADDLWTSRPEERTEFYNMSVFPHAGGFIGLPTIFRVEYELARGTTGPGQSRWNGPIDVEIASSADGFNWRRAWPRINLIPHGAPGEFNSGAILGLASAPVNYRDETWVYYTVLTTDHGGAMPPKRIAIARADWRRDGFVSLDIGPEGGDLQTKPLVFGAPCLVVNADASRGALRAAILEADGRPIEGLALTDCEPFASDSTSGVMKWNGGRQPPTDRPVWVVLQMHNCRIFSLRSGG